MYSPRSCHNHIRYGGHLNSVSTYQCNTRTGGRKEKEENRAYVVSLSFIASLQSTWTETPVQKHAAAV